jgi:glucoamylase
MSDHADRAPGGPGIPPRWTSSAKQGVGTAVSQASRVWFTLSHGIFDEIYYPRVDQACTRDMGMLVTAHGGFFSEEKRSALHKVSLLAPGVPGYRQVNTCEQKRYRLEKEIVTDSDRAVVLQHTRFVPLTGDMADYQLYVLLAPHLANRGWGNTGWIGEYKGVPLLYAERDSACCALACSARWVRRSAGFVGTSDGWQDISRNKAMTWSYDRAEDGNIALTGEIDIQGCGGELVLALGFGRNPAEAGSRAVASLSAGFASAKAAYIRGWQEWQGTLLDLPTQGDLYRISTAVIRSHEDKNFPGGMIASLSVPWGFSKGDDDLGGYHLVWARDLVETAGGLLAAGAYDMARRMLLYLATTQESDGHWSQNMWLDGTPYWHGVQMDETALPILLANLALREKAFGSEEPPRWLWKMVRSAAAYIVANGPVTAQDRWEEDPGYSPFTLGAEIAALLAAADMADAHKEVRIAAYLRETADAWNESVERWTYVSDTDLARQHGVKGYYVRITPPEVSDASSPAAGFVAIKNRPPGLGQEAASHVVSPDALALVRFGLRAPDDPRILDTVRVIDALLRVETPLGPLWHRYNDDGYGEHEDGSPFDGTGTGRAWPLITGERANYELLAGHTETAQSMARALEAFAGVEGLIPEQVWDAPDIPERELIFGRPSGSAMPLVWAHAEYIKLLRSLRDGRVFDAPPQAVARYAKGAKGSAVWLWRFSHKPRTLPAGKSLRIDVPALAVVRWSVDGKRRLPDITTPPTGLGGNSAELPTAGLPLGTKIQFTLEGDGAAGQEDASYEVEIT